MRWCSRCSSDHSGARQESFVSELGFEIGGAACAKVFQEGWEELIPSGVWVTLLESVHPDGGNKPKV
ncbi:hypothetical protein RchiOBHm_Chr6g0290361 [Rosa chinensis]|uniref:Uncharacterized protein n=1 Tax=Rosa chinensis TaxID=74649 RepID=A0A2P6PVU7_ROSCH|nr:hypothetical protein RchiOBHm_Chr6g0290361 [Rosa chinensis]